MVRMTKLNKNFNSFMRGTAVSALCAFVCASASAAVVQRGTASRAAPARTSNAAAIKAAQTNATTSASSATAAASVAAEPAPAVAVTQPAVAEKPVVVATPEPVIIENKANQFDASLQSASVTNTAANDNNLAEMIRRQRAALDAADATATAAAATAKSIASGKNACDDGLRACMQSKCGTDFTKCSGDDDTTFGMKLDTCRRDTTCTGHEYQLFTTEIRADRDMNARLASYNRVLDCGNQYNDCILTECGDTYSKCLGKTAGDTAISKCATIAKNCTESDSGLAARTMEVFGTLRQDAEVQVKKDEQRLYDIRDKMAEVCHRLGASFDERSFTCVYTVNFWAGTSSDIPYASKKAYAGATFDCTQNWFGIDVTTFKENAYRATREQKSATSGLMGAGVGVAAGAITSGAIGRAIDTKKAENAVKKAEKQNAAADAADKADKTENQLVRKSGGAGDDGDTGKEPAKATATGDKGAANAGASGTTDATTKEKTDTTLHIEAPKIEAPKPQFGIEAASKAVVGERKLSMPTTTSTGSKTPTKMNLTLSDATK